ncbi:Holliday junction branch migration protein RuvA [candidate division WOR-3 bacterium]|uniref:Holliday junction branch migration complex subunit RuvA n=1 Tax=candidate division WOR-3 bacterium TaxID=2052148 RepID=A0A937XCA0_UNCW3|nr:Holliday junction branch migration protein RuvA [candidate division WOR-3 bacterium]
MLARLRGLLAEKDPTRVVVDCQGIGFGLKVPLSTSRRLADDGGEVTLHVHTHFTREGVELFGFLDKDERTAFQRLMSVSGIGPKAGLNLLSRFAPAEIESIIANGKADVLRTVPGIGPTKADSIIKKLQAEALPPEGGSGLLADAESALVSLGLTHREAKERLRRVGSAESLSLQELLKLALAHRG